MELTVLRHLNQVMLTFVQKDFIARLVLFRHNRVLQEHLILQQDDKVLMSVLIVHLDIIVPTTT
jgi:hypothetical protein